VAQDGTAVIREDHMAEDPVDLAEVSTAIVSNGKNSNAGAATGSSCPCSTFF